MKRAGSGRDSGNPGNPGNHVSGGLLTALLLVLAYAPVTRVQQALAGSTELPPVVVQGTRTPLSNHGVNSSNLVPDLGKTGTPLKDLPASVQTIPRDLLTG